MAKVYYCDLFGNREEKYRFLLEQDLSSINWKEIKPEKPYYFFIPKDFSFETEYRKGFSLNELFPICSSGVKTHDDSNLVNFKPFNGTNNRLYTYRPFDTRFINYDLKRVKRHRYSIMRHFIIGDNVGIIFKRGFTENASSVFISNHIIDMRSWSRPGMQGGDYIVPLYLYPEKDALNKTENRRPNLSAEITNIIADKINLRFTEEETGDDGTFSPIDILDYIYAVLHSPAYRTRYREFLKIDFPRVPYPANAEQFRRMAEFGAKLRQTHLLEDDLAPPEDLARPMASYPIDGSNTIDSLVYKDEKVWINKQQYFEKVPTEAWNFYIGGYQPAQKWLKDRKGRTLNFDEIQHYQRIVGALCLTGDLQRRIDEVYNTTNNNDSFIYSLHK